MKFSIITAVYNRESTIADAVSSLQSQTYEDYEHIVVDGGSRDGTLVVLRSLVDKRSEIVSEPDRGIYDALNKGLARASGDILGLLHSDDMFASEHILSIVASEFRDPDVDAVYGDLHYVSLTSPNRVIRKWQSGNFTPSELRRGWMPPHPALFLRRKVIEEHGDYDTRFRIAADYDAVLRYFSQPGFRAVYVPEVFVRMRTGGESNRSLGRIFLKSREDYQALRRNCVGGMGTLFLKNTRKISQFFD